MNKLSAEDGGSFLNQTVVIIASYQKFLRYN